MQKHQKRPLHEQMACTSNFDHVMNVQNTHAYHVLNFFQAQYSSQLRKKMMHVLKQSWIHGYRSRVRVGRGRDEKG